jgi:hypothetical protein
MNSRLKMLLVVPCLNYVPEFWSDLKLREIMNRQALKKRQPHANDLRQDHLRQGWAII